MTKKALFLAIVDMDLPHVMVFEKPPNKQTVLETLADAIQEGEIDNLFNIRVREVPK